jgi:hypothetical protein
VNPCLGLAKPLRNMCAAPSRTKPHQQTLVKFSTGWPLVLQRVFLSDRSELIAQTSNCVSRETSLHSARLPKFGTTPCFLIGSFLETRPRVPGACAEWLRVLAPDIGAEHGEVSLAAGRRQVRSGGCSWRLLEEDFASVDSRAQASDDVLAQTGMRFEGAKVTKMSAGCGSCSKDLSPKISMWKS